MTIADKLAQITGLCPDAAVYDAIFKVAEYLGDRVDQDWKNEATRVTFEDGSMLVFSGPCITAEDK
jgi:hypothetical protein